MGSYTAAYLAGMFVRRITPWEAAVGNTLIAYVVSHQTRAAGERCLAATAIWEFLNSVASLLVAGVGLFALLAEEPSAGLVREGVTSIGVAVILVTSVAVLTARREQWLIRRVLSMTDLSYTVLERLSAERVQSLSREIVRAAVCTRAEQFFRTITGLASNRVLVGATMLVTVGAWAAQVTAPSAYSRST